MTDDIQKKIQALIRPEIRALKAYHVPDATGLIKLDAMENPYSWPQDLRREWLEVMRRVDLNRYPDPDARDLRAQLHQAMGCPDGIGLLLGNGSDELIQMMLMALARPESAVVSPVPTFVMYELIVRAVGVKFVGVPLAPNFSLDVAAMSQAISTHKPAAVFLAYPNNPTGNLFDSDALAQIIREAPGVVVLDEAYYAFSGKSFLDLLDRHDNLLVMRTLSKLGLAGLRLGVLVGDPAWLSEFDKVRLPYNISSLTQASARFALDHQAVLDDQVKMICADREQLFQILTGMPGIKAWPSRTNFIMFRVEGRRGVDVFDALRHAGVLIKNLGTNHGPLQDCLRVTIGTPEENEAFLQALRQCI
jgi:histidinol-phosphate aminotransferase